MKKFIFEVQCSGIRQYMIFAENEKEARNKLEEYDLDEDDLSGEEISEDMERAHLIRKEQMEEKQ